jgi:peptidoglycan glycosyltransferase
MFERRVWWIGNVFIAILLLLSLRIVYWQLWRGNDLYYSLLDPGTVTLGEGNPPAWLQPGGLEDLPQPLVQRAVGVLSSTTRGRIFDREGEVLAEDAPTADGGKQRIYALPSLAPVLGYTSGIHLGITGLELRYNGTLLGLNRLDSQLEQLVHEPVTGSDLVLTIDSQVQQAAASALGGRTGSVTVFDGRTGAILAMVSAPHIDPNRVTEPGYLSSVGNDPGAPLINRATQGLFTPGSTFKTVPLIAALDTGQVTPDTMFNFGEPLRDASGRVYYVYRVGGGEIPDPNHSEDRLDLTMSYAKSANAAFGQIGAEMSAETLIAYSQRFGFSAPEGQGIPVELPLADSQLAQDLDELSTNPLLRAATAIGQGELLTNTYSMGLPVLAVLNDGTLPVPYLVARIKDPTGLEHKGPLVGRTIPDMMKPETARAVQQIMITSAEKGWAQTGRVEGVTVGGKTGTAQLGGDRLPHAWYLGFARSEERVVVIVVMVENGGEGSTVAAPIFAQIVPTALQAAEPAPSGFQWPKIPGLNP